MKLPIKPIRTDFFSILHVRDFELFLECLALLVYLMLTVFEVWRYQKKTILILKPLIYLLSISSLYIQKYTFCIIILTILFSNYLIDFESSSMARHFKKYSKSNSFKTFVILRH